MLRNHTFGMVVSVTVTLALSGVAFARGERYRAEKVGHSPADEAQMRELLAKLAAAAGEPAPEERTDADLMYEAMLRWNGEPPGSAAIDRLLDQSKKEAARTKRATVEKVRHMFWKDPFADDPHKLIPVRQDDRDMLDAYDRRTPRKEWRQSPREARESEVSRLRTELAQARAENSRLRDRADMTSDARSCVADTSETSSAEVRPRRRASRPPVHHRHAERTEMVLASTAPQVFLPPPAPASAPPPPPPAHGIIIEQLPSPPPPPAAESGRRHRTR